MVDTLISKFVNFDPEAEGIDRIPLCKGVACVTLGLGYTAGEANWTTHVVEHIRKQHAWTTGMEIKKLGNTYEDTLAYLSAHPNTTQAAVIFCTGPLLLPNTTYPLLCAGNASSGLLLYSLVVNFTSANLPILLKPDERSPITRHILPYKVAVDRGILDYLSTTHSLPPISLNVSMSDYPHLANRMAANFDTVTLQGPMYFYLPPMVVFIMLMTEMVREKEQHLREVLNIVGIRQVAYWASWLIVGVGMDLVVSCVTVGVGRGLGFDFFTKTPFGYILSRVLMSLFAGFTLNMLVFGCFLVTILSSGKAAYTVTFTQLTYSLLLGGIVLQGFISSHLLLMILHITDLPGAFAYIRYILALYPPFQFSTAFYEISRRSSWHPLYMERRWAEGEGYEWAHFWLSQEGWLKGHQFITPSLGESLMKMCWNTALFACLAWICDTSLASNRGAVHSILHWCKRKTPNIYSTTADFPQSSSTDSVDEETERVKVLRRQQADSGLQVVNLSHVYRKYPCGFHAASDVFALSGFYLTAERDEVLTLLGHNGAGKSTLMGILTGLIAPTHGTALVNGIDISENVDTIRRHTGYCPQHSILWEELTAYEHLYLFSRLKGLTPLQSRLRTNQMLLEVDLLTCSDARIATFSGGMRRRLSIALAGTGNPDILLLDEPTTGLDPINRFQVWKLIHRLKRSRVVVLTTHSMEEAEALSDRIAILVNGRLQCIGSSLYLKNRFGGGYQVCLLTKQPELVLSRIISAAPSALTLTHNADSLTVGLSDITTAQAVFALAESGLEGLITAWELRHPSLEQAFLAVTGSLAT
jgi:ABC-type multidrug transport system ATPase subunit